MFVYMCVYVCACACAWAGMGMQCHAVKISSQVLWSSYSVYECATNKRRQMQTYIYHHVDGMRKNLYSSVPFYF